MMEIKHFVVVAVASGDELLLTEMIFNGVFNDLTIQQCVSLLSCFVFEERVSVRIYMLSHVVVFVSASHQVHIYGNVKHVKRY